MNKKNILGLAVAIVLPLILLAYFGFHRRSAADSGEHRGVENVAAAAEARTKDIFPKNPSGNKPVSADSALARMPLDVSGKELVELTKRGDVAATEQLFRDTVQCNHASEAIQLIEAKLKACEKEDREKFKKSCDQARDQNLRNLSTEKENSAVCGGVTKPQLDSMRYLAVTKAAELGDLDAQACFVESDFDLRGPNKPPDLDVDKYQLSAIKYLNSGMERGDWRFVDLMATSGVELSHAKGFLGLVASGDDMTIYRMTRLLRLGATGEYAARLDRRLQNFLDASAADPSAYPPAKLAAEDAWAKREYEQHFINSPLLDARPTPCVR